MRAGEQVPGCTYGTAAVARSSVSMAEFERLKRAIGFTHADEEVDRMHRAWTRFLALQVSPWSNPSVKEGEW